MRRHTKPFLLIATLVCAVWMGILALDRIRSNGTPFADATVILDDASWQSRKSPDREYPWFQWTAPNTLLYSQTTADGSSLVRRQVASDRSISPPEVLPIVLTKTRIFRSLSPDGTTALCQELTGKAKPGYVLLRTDGPRKPVRFASTAFALLWSPDSKFIYGITVGLENRMLERFDAKTGTVVKTPLDTTKLLVLSTITPEGRLLIQPESQPGSVEAQTVSWEFPQVKDGEIVAAHYQEPLFTKKALPRLSPDGKRILWAVSEEEVSLRERLEKYGSRDLLIAQHSLHYWVTEIDGSHAERLGVVHSGDSNKDGYNLQWTPDSKGISFTCDNKLWYLAVP